MSSLDINLFKYSNNSYQKNFRKIWNLRNFEKNLELQRKVTKKHKILNYFYMQRKKILNRNDKSITKIIKVCIYINALKVALQYFLNVVILFKTTFILLLIYVKTKYDQKKLFF